MFHINEEQWTEMVDLLEEDFIPLINNYLIDSVARLEVIKLAKINNDNEAAIDAAHAMKGASASLGVELLAKHCGTMQSVCEAKMLDGAFNVIEDIETELTFVTKLIKERLKKLS